MARLITVIRQSHGPDYLCFLWKMGQIPTCHLSSLTGDRLELLSDPTSINIIFSFRFPPSYPFTSPVFVPAFSVSDDKLTWTGLIFFFFKFVLPCTCAKLLPSCPTLCSAIDWGLPGSSVHGILQARILEWVASPFSRGLLLSGTVKSGGKFGLQEWLDPGAQKLPSGLHLFLAQPCFPLSWIQSPAGTL